MSSTRAPARHQTRRHPMRVVARRTGLNAETLRVWERRYGVVHPGRTHTGRRLYSDADIERLQLLHRATLGGRSIGLVAALTNPELEELVRQDAESDLARRPRTPTEGARDYPTADIVTECLAALERYDIDTLGTTLRRAALVLPAGEFLEQVVAELLRQAGARWREGSFRAVHGHLAATVARRVLEQFIDVATPRAPRLVMATPTGQLHELGGLLAAAAAAADGWSVTWLGANLSAADIAEAATALRVRAVGVSLVHPPGDAAVNEELRRLRSLLPRSIELLVGGAAAAGYADTLQEIGCTPVDDVGSMTARLRAIINRNRPSDPPAASGRNPRITRRARRSS